MNKNAELLKKTIDLIMADEDDSMESIDFRIGVCGRIILSKAPYLKGTPVADTGIRMKIKMPAYTMTLYFNRYEMIEDADDTLMLCYKKKDFVGSFAVASDCVLGEIA